ncbi:MAG: hypothetical protein RIQ81_2699 [Pseudomonadota bacterium]
MRRIGPEAAITALIALLAPFAAAKGAMAQDPFPAGVESKSAGMESAVAARSAPAALYNPANLGQEPAEGRTYLEAGAVRARATYEHPEFDQVYVQIMSPTATLGATGSLLDPRLRAGFTVFPTRSGNLAINGLPQRVSGEIQPLAVENAEHAVKSALGLSWELAPGIHLGTGAIHATERREITARVVGSATPLLKQTMKNNFVRGIAGLRADSRFGSFAAAYTSSVTKSYEGNRDMAGSEPGVRPQAVSYDPAVIAAGWSLALGRHFGAEVSLNQRKWNESAAIMREGLADETHGADIHDVLESGIRAWWKTQRGWRLGAAIAELPSPWGEGGTSATGSQRMMGPGFGMSNGVDRRSLGLSAQTDQVTLGSLDFGSLDFAFMNTWGSRTVSTVGAAPGHYQMDVVTLTASTTKVF